MPKRRLPRGGGTQVALSPELAVATIALFSAFADGDVSSDAEAYALGEMVSCIDLYSEYTVEDFAALGAEIGGLINEAGVEAVVAQAVETVRDEGVEEAAFIVALVVLVADGEVPEEEQEFVDDLRQALRISVERADEIVSELFSEEEYEEEEEAEEDEDESEEE
ncbi:tellurite resistance TerB family protein [Nodosilinea sp. LEGE 06152]|uniref:tellurite resistance TerB family protein n=1 Tax=Nodosilinea sp. LEGE 06152 TaxID=2777966 RepID=UPI0018829D2C|nr:tellurite resistance TerB family protein [Nodosilinea sp. LEGE 06152]MBE9158485.1 tellurite resistance TerB family protein [Nodosilinea sp. LEGE 06152]